MAGNNRSTSGAIYIEKSDGGDQLFCYRVVRDGILGIAYVKKDRIIGFKPISDFLEEFYTGIFLMANGDKLDLPKERADQLGKMK